MYNGPILANIQTGQHAFQPRVTLSYKATPDTLFYGVFAKGYRVGGVNDTIGLTLLPGQKLEDSPAPLTYKTDSLYNYELGVKSQLWGGKFDLAAYYIDWSNIQQSVFFPSPVTPSGGVGAISNAGAATIRGAEAQFTIRPAKWIEIVSSVSYNDAKLRGPSPAVKSALTGQLVSAPAGTQLPGSRKWQTSNTLVLRAKAGGVPLTFTAAHQYASSTLTDIVYQVPLPSYNLVSVNIDAQLQNNVRVGLFARNLFDEHTRVMDFIFAPRTYIVLTPRTLGASLSVDF
jgi:outer membrane receptor protein involved in Fe transport